MGRMLKSGTLYEVVCELYEEAFTRRKMTTSELANKSGLCHQTVHNLLWEETRFPRFNTVVKIAEALGYAVELKRQSVGIPKKPAKPRRKKRAA